MMRAAIILGLTLVGAVGAQDLRPAPVERYHAYWLTPHPPRPNSATDYPVLLLARVPIDELQKSSILFPAPLERQIPLLDQLALTFVTYRKDSVWNVDGVPFKPLRSFSALRPKEADVIVNGTTYRYEAAAPADVLRLLERPEGSIPISRLHAPLSGAEQTARALRLFLREQVRDDAKK